MLTNDVVSFEQLGPGRSLLTCNILRRQNLLCRESLHICITWRNAFHACLLYMFCKNITVNIHLLDLMINLQFYVLFQQHGNDPKFLDKQAWVYKNL